MFRRVVGATLLAVWSVLFGIVLSESVGFIQEPPDANGSVEVWLISFGKAIRTSKQTQITVPPSGVVKPSAFYRPVFHYPSFNWITKDTEFLKEDIPIYKLHRSFLI
jgi:hypothetical protein